MYSSMRRLCVSSSKLQQVIPRVGSNELVSIDECGGPFILTGGMGDWPAMRWDLRFLRERYGECIVPVEISEGNADYRSMYDPAFAKARGRFEAGCLMRFNEFVEHFITDMDTREKGLRGCIAQCRLDEYFPGLSDGIRIPAVDDIRRKLQQTNYWLGAAGTKTPLHRDPYSNLLCQVMGEKYVRLYDPRYTSNMHTFPVGFLRNTSMVDVENSNEHHHPVFQSTPFWEGTIVPGEMLYVPNRWWHYVRSCTTSFSVNFWWNRCV